MTRGNTLMGVDPLDVMFRIERTFGVALSQEEWPYLFDTAGHLHRMICAKLDGRQPMIPDVLAVQRLLGEWLAEQPGYRWWRVTLSNGQLSRIVSHDAIEQAWRDLAGRLKCELPALETDRSGRPRFPSECDTREELTRWCIRHCPSAVPPIRTESIGPPLPARARWTDAAVWQALQKCLSQALGVSIAQVTPEARLVEDLGMS